MDNRKRCEWVEVGNEAYYRYHDEEWGQPLYDDHELFELLCMETYQAGLSWQLVINKRDAFHRAFHDYEVTKVAAMTSDDVELLMDDASIIRNRMKLQATITNAQAFLAIQQEYGSFAKFFWSFVADNPIDHKITVMGDIPTKNDLSESVAKAFKKKGFKFLGPVSMYSYLQGAGLINDHELSCEWH
ncbi:DNA-3-methyladenine glycosylase I [Periweissella cryptocerci]|uniref:DNA-3-methyladenine glycosylase I n=1 Tax=Periweissella cryptocerci TaxID=2506420 RepID=A0A4P6YS56_9LACO|nr:DNA-3-methyladenine glycosylase I [Periweissella cryptocerci]QBO35507.1 DNA-3-methyladenine glycosylase I [Periweissella cryptocerci]